MRMKRGARDMKILRISKGKGYFRTEGGGDWIEIDRIDKDNLLDLLDLFLGGDVKIDDASEQEISNPAQRIIYERITGKLLSLRDNKAKFKDECDRMYMKELKKYSTEDTPQTS